jgi:hypothetical protein
LNRSRNYAPGLLIRSWTTAWITRLACLYFLEPQHGEFSIRRHSLSLIGSLYLQLVTRLKEMLSIWRWSLLLLGSLYSQFV